jgi:FAD/FMN-containing dehydrogenase
MPYCQIDGAANMDIKCMLGRIACLLLAIPLAQSFDTEKLWGQDSAKPSSIVVDDASRLNNTPVSEVLKLASDPQAAETQLRELLSRARKDHLKVSIAGARHSMGGHTIYPGGIVLDMLPFNRLELDTSRAILHAGSGARWADVIPYLDAKGFSVAVMQSFNDFSVGGSISVNCHGWQSNRPPIDSTVESFRLMTADGEIVRCSRRENSELFSLVLGGYGLFGVILDVDLHVVPNERYRQEMETVPEGKLPSQIASKLQDDQIKMIYGRLCVVPGERTFLRESILVDYRLANFHDGTIPPLKPLENEEARRKIYRDQIGNQAAKELRWKLERSAGELATGQYYSRNQLLNENTVVFQEQDPNRTDILQEYFIPPEQFNRFLELARAIIPKHNGELLNVTVRTVRQDKDSFLHYAEQNVLALVMAFSENRTTEADQRMEPMTQALIDAAIECNGRYYLPYRLHATPAEFQRAYPMAARFF